MRAKKSLEAANNELEINLDNALKVRCAISCLFAFINVMSFCDLIVMSSGRMRLSFSLLLVLFFRLTENSRRI